MNNKFMLVIFCILSLTISGCSSDKNIEKLDEELFNDGKQIVKLYAKVYNGDDDSASEASDLVEDFLSSYKNDSNLSESEMQFVYQIEILYLQYRNFMVKSVSEEISGDSVGESDEFKEEMKNTLLEFKESFGISLE